MSYNVGLVYIELLGTVLVNPMSYNVGLVHRTTLSYWPARRRVLRRGAGRRNEGSINCSTSSGTNSSFDAIAASIA